MLKHINFLLSVIISLSYGVEVAEQAVANEKFQFVQEIYSDSWALIIGINKYQNVEPLTYAVADEPVVHHSLHN